MTRVFADSFFFFAILNPRDVAHGRAVDFSRQHTGPLVTTAWVLTEVADGLSLSPSRQVFRQLFQRIESDPDHQIVPATDEWFRKGIALYDARPDKTWSLTDCISFAVMSEWKIHEAVTGDHHFEQAGFIALLK